MKAKTSPSAGTIRASEAISLLGLLQYQKGAVVSRTLLKHTAGLLTVFAFDAGQGLSEHTSPFDALVYVLEGEVEITVAGKPIKPAAGDLILLPSNKPHGLRAVTRFKMRLTMLRA